MSISFKLFVLPFFFCLVSQCNLWAADEWPMFKSDVAHSSVNSFDAIQPPFNLQFSLSTGVTNEVSYSSPAVLHNTTYIGSINGTIMAISGNLTGSQATTAMWTYQTGSPIYGSPTVASLTYGGVTQDYVFVGSTDGNLYGFNGSNGVEVFEENLGGPIFTSPIIVTEGTTILLICASHSGTIVAYNITNSPLSSEASVSWETKISNNYLFSSPTYDATTDLVYEPSYDGKLYAIHASGASAGVTAWATTVSPTRASPVVTNGYLYNLSNSGILTCLQKRNGFVKASVPIGATASSSPAAFRMGGASYDTVITCGQNGAVQEWNLPDSASNFTQVWQHTLPDSVYSSPAIAAAYLNDPAGNAAIYVGCNDGNLYGLNLDSGTLLTTIAMGKTVQVSPAIAEGALFASSSNGKIQKYVSNIVWRVAAGSTSNYVDAAGKLWTGDDGLYMGGSVTTTSAAITGTSDQVLYQTARVVNNGAMTYVFNVQSGLTYQTTLKFAAIDGINAAFSVTINGAAVTGNPVTIINHLGNPVTDFSIPGTNTANDEVFNDIAPSNGAISIIFSDPPGTYAQINAIQIIPQPAPLSTWRVVAGSTSGYKDAAGNVWYGDDGLYNGGSVTTTSAAITGTSDQILYQSARVVSNGPMTYTFSVPNGNYQPTLKFAAIDGINAAFSVTINGAAVTGNPVTVFSIGFSSPTTFFGLPQSNTATDVVFNPITASNGAITIIFSPAYNSFGYLGEALVNSIQIIPQPTPSSTWRVAAGSTSSYKDAAGNIWTGDDGLYNGGSVTTTSAAITGTTDQVLYQSARVISNGAMTYTFNVPNGNYQTTLKFADIDGLKSAFSVTINGAAVMGNPVTVVNIFGGSVTDFGIPVTNTADDQVFNNIIPSNGAITIVFSTPSGTGTYAQINAIQIIPQPAASVSSIWRVAAGSTSSYKDSGGNIWTGDDGVYSPGIGCSNGSCRSPNGSWGANSTFPTTAWTATSPPGARTRPPFSGKANQAIRARSPTSNCCAKCPSAQMC